MVKPKGDERRTQPGRAEEGVSVYFPLMSVSDAAAYLGVSRKTIYRLIEWNEIRAVKDGKAVRVEKKSLDEFRESGKLT